MLVKIIKRIKPTYLRIQFLLIRIFRRHPFRIGLQPRTISVKEVSGRASPYFFGYHDKTPFSLDGSKLLATHLPVRQDDPTAECTRIKVGYFGVNSSGEVDKQFVGIGTTNTWCWQQGCMLQWDPKAPDQRIYYNDMVNGAFGSKRFNLKTQQVEQNNAFPIYSISGDGAEALSLNFSRLGRLRPGYGYDLLDDPYRDDPSPVEDGVFLYDFSCEQGQMLICLQDLADRVPQVQNAEHYINHASFSPGLEWITFFHIWRFKDSGRRGIILYAYNRSIDKLVVIEEERLPSHFCWRDAQSILVTNLDGSGRWRYSIYELGSGKRVDLDLPQNQDGHPMFKPGSRKVFVTDSYPDKRRDQHVLIVDLEQNTVEEIGALYSPFKFRGQVRCDLHPRWDRTGGLICVDTAETGKREMLLYHIDLPD